MSYTRLTKESYFTYFDQEVTDKHLEAFDAMGIRYKVVYTYKEGTHVVDVLTKDYDLATKCLKTSFYWSTGNA